MPFSDLDEFVVAFLLGLIGVMADEELPPHRLVFGRHRMEGRDFVVLRQPVRADRAAALQVFGIAAGFQQQDGVAGLGQARGDDAAARARSDDDVFVSVDCAFTLRPPDLKGGALERLQELDQRTLVVVGSDCCRSSGPC